MPWTAFIFLSLTFVCWRFVQVHPHEVARFLASLSAIACLLIGLFTAPILLQSLILLSLLIQPAIAQERYVMHTHRIPRRLP